MALEYPGACVSLQHEYPVVGPKGKAANVNQFDRIVKVSGIPEQLDGVLSILYGDLA